MLLRILSFLSFVFCFHFNLSYFFIFWLIIMYFPTTSWYHERCLIYKHESSITIIIEIHASYMFKVQTIHTYIHTSHHPHAHLIQRQRRKKKTKQNLHQQLVHDQRLTCLLTRALDTAIKTEQHLENPSYYAACLSHTLFLSRLKKSGSRLFCLTK